MPDRTLHPDLDGSGAAACSCLLALTAWAVFGTLRTPDTPGYIAYAQQILNHTVPAGQALLQAGPSPVSLFRTPGYPLLLALLMRLAGSDWVRLLILLQIGAGAAMAALCVAAARRLGAGRAAALAAGLLPAIGFALLVQLAVLTDGLYVMLIIAAALLPVLGGWPRVALAGLALAAATALREATPYLALFFLPLAVAGPRPTIGAPLLRAALLLLPCLGMAAGLAAFNQHRIGQPLITTSRQLVMVQAVLPLLAAHLPVYDGTDPFDAAARASLGDGAYDGIDIMNDRLFREHAMTAPELATIATARYWRSWRRFPGPMLAAALDRIRPEFLSMPFQPIDTVAALMVYAHRPRPVFDRLNLLWRSWRRGSAWAAFWIAADVTTRLGGLAIAMLAIAAPLRAPRSIAVWGLWTICAGFFCVYLPVHIETRYLVPVSVLAGVLAAATLRKRTSEEEEVSNPPPGPPPAPS